MDLRQQKCIPCQGNQPHLTEQETQKLLPKVLGWEVKKTIDGHAMITKTFRFKNFAGSIDFVNKIKDVAETEGHHPDLYIHFDMVRVENWTHAIGGLHQNDFILAAKINDIR